MCSTTVLMLVNNKYYFLVSISFPSVAWCFWSGFTDLRNPDPRADSNLSLQQHYASACALPSPALDWFLCIVWVDTKRNGRNPLTAYYGAQRLIWQGRREGRKYSDEKKADERRTAIRPAGKQRTRNKRKGKWEGTDDRRLVRAWPGGQTMEPVNAICCVRRKDPLITCFLHRLHRENSKVNWSQLP